MDPILIAGCFARTLAFVHVAPFFAEDSVPERARLSLAFVLALLIAPAGGVGASLLVRLLLEALTGLVLGLAVALPWATVSALLPQVAAGTGLEDEEEGIAARLAAAVALACFLGLSGERWLLSLLAAPAHAPIGASVAELAMSAGGAVWALASGALVPFLAVLAAARLAFALAMRAAAIDLSPFHAPALALAGMLLVLAYVQAAPVLFEDALHEGTALTATGGQR